MVGSPTDPELRKWAAEHLAYEVWMLRGLIDRIGGVTIQTADAAPVPDQVLLNAVIESFALHARGMMDFLWGARSQPDDAIAADYVEEWEERRVPQPSVLNEVKPRVGKEVAHLTYHRLNVAGDAKNWRNGEIWLAIRDAIKELVAAAPDERMSEETKIKIRSYLG